MSFGYITDLNPLQAHRPTPNETHKMNTTTIDGYTPKNKKCFIYPFNYAVMTNNSGGKTVLKYELFDTTENEFNLSWYSVVSCSPSLFVIPWKYKGQEQNFEENISFNNFPQLPWNYDLFKNWQALNSNTLTMSYISKGVSMAANIATGNIGGVIGGISDIANTAAAQMDKANIPEDTRGNTQGNALLYSGGAGCFLLKQCCQAEYIAKIDDYFTRFGYLVNEVKKPLLKNRKNFDYIQTNGMALTGGVPSDDLEELQKIFDNGVTLWHNPETFGDYEVDNATL